MAPVLIDTTADFSPAVMPATTTSPAGQPRSLLLAPPSLAAHEDRLRAAFSAFDRATTDLQMLDRLSAGLVTLPAATYELVLVLNGGGGGASQRSEMSRAAYALLVPAMATGGLLRFQDGPPRAGDAREAILAGLVERGDGFEKLLQEETVIPLRFGKKKKTDAPPPVRGGEDNAVKFDFNFDDVDDDIIDENDLLSEEDLKRRPVIRQSPQLLAPERDANTLQPRTASRRSAAAPARTAPAASPPSSRPRTSSAAPRPTPASRCASTKTTSTSSTSPSRARRARATTAPSATRSAAPRAPTSACRRSSPARRCTSSTTWCNCERARWRGFLHGWFWHGWVWDFHGQGVWRGVATGDLRGLGNMAV